MNYKLIKFNQMDAVGTITLNNPKEEMPFLVIC